jgi:E3 ubiquitin-protein ligase BIG BROTHER-like protein
MMLTGHGGEGSEYGDSDAGSYDDYEGEDDEGSEWEEEGEGVLPDGDGEDEEVGDADPAAYEDDEAYARALQDAEEREVAQRLMALAGITDCECRTQQIIFFVIQSRFLPLPFLGC